MKILFGIRPTSEYIHLGHIAVLKKISDFINKNKNEEKFNVYIFIANYHALTTGSDEEKKERFQKMKEYENKLFLQCVRVINYYLDKESTLKVNYIYYQQYQNLKILDIFIKLLNITSYAEITSIPTIKEFKKNMKKDEYLSAGFINYPILQVADVISINPDYVFVGKDQLPNLKILNKLVRKYNKVYNENIKEDIKVMALEENIPGYDGRKMSKSYNNVINIEDDVEEIKNKIRIYPTDGHLKGTSGNYNNCLFYKLAKSILNDNTIKEMEEYCTSNNSLCKKCKDKFGGEIIYLLKTVI